MPKVTQHRHTTRHPTHPIPSRMALTLVAQAAQDHSSCGCKSRAQPRSRMIRSLHLDQSLLVLILLRREDSKKRKRKKRNITASFHT